MDSPLRLRVRPQTIKGMKPPYARLALALMRSSLNRPINPLNSTKDVYIFTWTQCLVHD